MITTQHILTGRDGLVARLADGTEVIVGTTTIQVVKFRVGRGAKTHEALDVTGVFDQDVEVTDYHGRTVHTYRAGEEYRHRPIARCGTTATNKYGWSYENSYLPDDTEVTCTKCLDHRH